MTSPPELMDHEKPVSSENGPRNYITWPDFSMKVELMRHYRILSNFNSTEVPSGLFCDCVVEDSQGMEVCVDIFA